MLDAGGMHHKIVPDVMRHWVRYALSLLLCVTACTTRTATQELLAASFATAGKLPIDLIAPVTGQLTSSRSTSFSWSERIPNYQFELARDSAFSQIIVSKRTTSSSYALQSSDLVSGVVLANGTYYWRVRVPDVANNLQSKTGSLYMQYIPEPGSSNVGLIYVNKNSSSSSQNGSRENPYKTIQSAIAAADALRNGDRNIAMAVRVAQGTYAEDITLLAGISIYGGYSTSLVDFAGEWARSISGYVTTINGVTSRAVRAGSDITTTYRGTTVMDGFTINGVYSNDTWVVYLYQASPTISNNNLVGASAVNGTTYGIQATSGSPLIRANTITLASGGLNATGLNLNSISSSTVEQNLITVSASSGCYAFDVTSAQNSKWYNNQIVIYGCFNFDSVGIELKASSGEIAGNTIYGAAPTGNGERTSLRMKSGTSVSVYNNIMYSASGGGTGNQYCISEDATGNNPIVVRYNDLFGCATALYRDADSGCPGVNCTAIANVNGLGAAYGNNVNLDNAGNVLFVNEASYDLRIKTTSACNVRAGGLNLPALLNDRFGTVRTTSAGCSPTNGGQGFSIGAHENDA